MSGLLQAAGVAFAGFGGGNDFFRFEKFAFVLDPVEEFRDVRLVEIAVEDHAVTLHNLVAGVGESVGEVAVVGEDEEAFAVLVEASGAEHALALEVGGEEVKDGLSAVGVGVGAEEALGFVEDEGDGAGGLGGEGLLVNEDGVFGLTFIAEFGDFAVVADFAVADEGLRFAAGTESGVGDDFLEALWFLLGHGSTSVEEGRGCQCCGRVTFVLALARVYKKNR